MTDEMMTVEYYESPADKDNYCMTVSFACDYTSPHFHNSTEIAFVLSGEFTVRGNGTVRCLQAGDVFYADSYVVHSYKGSPSCRALILVIAESLLRDYRNCCNGTLPMFMYSKENCDNRELIEFVSYLHKSLSGLNLLKRKGAINWILGYLTDCYPPESAADNGEQSFVVQMLQYIDANFADELTANMTAKKFGYSPNYFSVLFYRYTGMHFRDYLNRVRLQKTEQMRKSDPSLAVAAAAMSCGFASLNTYYRALKKAGGDV